MPINPGRVLYRDDYLLAVHKLPEELVVRGRGEVGKLPLLDFLRKDEPGIRPIHRLDFETSGVLFFARRKEALEKVIESKFAGWTKIYRAIVMGKMLTQSGIIKAKLAGHEPGQLLPAETAYQVVEKFDDCTDVEARFEKGRHHQIRRHFASIGHALALDPLYGDKKRNISFTKRYGFRRFFLHALRVELIHPITGEKLVVTSPLPKPYLEAIARFRRGGERLPKKR